MNARNFASLSLLLLVACNDKDTSSSTTVAQVAAGDAHCPTGGVSVTSNGTTAYACSGIDGLAGPKGDLGLTGAQGDPGLQGLTGAMGGGHYVSRANVYCVTKSASSLPTTDTGVEARCRTTTDLPLHGSCYQADRDDIALSLSSNSGWEAPTPAATPAGYSCGWSKAGFSLPLLTIPSATAEICCVTVPTP